MGERVTVKGIHGMKYYKILKSPGMRSYALPLLPHTFNLI